MSALNKTNCSYGAGVAGVPVTVFRKKIDTTVTPLTAGIDYALMKLPKGFSPARAFVDVQAIDGVLTFDLDVMTAAGVSKGLLIDNQSVAATGLFLVENAVASAMVVDSDDVYLAIDVSAAMTTAIFEVAVAGFWLMEPSDMALTLTDETLL